MRTSYEPPEVKSLRKELPSYVAEIKVRKSHSSKMIFFAKFLENVFGISVEDIYEDLDENYRDLLGLERKNIPLVEQYFVPGSAAPDN